MFEFTVRIGDHNIQVHTRSEDAAQWFQTSYELVELESTGPVNLLLHVSARYGSPFIDHSFTVSQENHLTIFERKDYRLAISPTFTEASLAVHDDFSLRHAMMNLYSTLIVHLEWGLLLHSSCVIDDGTAWLFSGRSGAGKSTAARLSAPRQLLSDEASIVRIRSGRVDALDSPFRSETFFTRSLDAVPVGGIHLLVQSKRIGRRRMESADAASCLMDKIFYWSFSTIESNKIMKLYARLLQCVPVYELEFQKNSRFWEVITCQDNTDGAVQPSLLN